MSENKGSRDTVLILLESVHHSINEFKFNSIIQMSKKLFKLNLNIIDKMKKKKLYKDD